MTKTLIATFTARPGRRERVALLVEEFAEAVRKEPGNLVFEVFTRNASDHDFVVFEQYQDDAAFDEHLANPAGIPFNAELNSLIVGEGSQLDFLNRPIRTSLR
ncbi:putative quinol monooxygenase [Leifsonia sp. AG29]|uniref:putative quinol monooxygenase n=1 Tax=Leifsonia sp. AG29 TaxID=2598860 RepID=UPI00131DB690|nr:putative quinol monooxygenase [Leifsonia sp. AG29]